MESATGEARLRISRRLSFAALVACIAVLCALILRPFIAPVAWAALIAYLTWPMYARFRTTFGRFASLSALAMTLTVLAVLIVPLAWILVLVQQELLEAFRTIAPSLSQKAIRLPTWLARLDPLGPWLQTALDQHGADPALLGRAVLQGLQRYSGDFARLLANAGRNAGRILITVFTLFFPLPGWSGARKPASNCGQTILWRPAPSLRPGCRGDGACRRVWIARHRLSAGRFGGHRLCRRGRHRSGPSGVVTGLASATPTIGTALVWVPVSVGLMLDGHPGRGVLLLLWGSLSSIPWTTSCGRFSSAA